MAYLHNFIFLFYLQQLDVDIATHVHVEEDGPKKRSASKIKNDFTFENNFLLLNIVWRVWTNRNYHFICN